LFAGLAGSAMSESSRCLALAWRGVWVLLALAFVLVSPRAFALEVPALAGRVSDYAELVPADAERRISDQLAAYEAKTGHQFAVLTIDSLEGDPLEDFSIRVVERWKLGKAGKDDGLLLLVAERERKARVEVGYGLEGDIPDAVAARVVRNVLVPAFRKGDYPGGIEQALAVLMKAGAGGKVELPPDSARSAEPRAPPGWLALLFFFVAPFLAIALLFARGGARRRGFLAGGWGFPGGFGHYGGSSRGGGFGGFGGGGFSGGGGGFGGGGASGSW
jgi:uncharacterized protein